jgi:(p)ppGpp synthase/HD superfamily hydrolase
MEPKDYIGEDFVDVAWKIMIDAMHSIDDEEGLEHSVAVATNAAKAGHSDEVIAAALLHDVVEDTGWELEDLQETIIPEPVIEAVGVLTHDPDVDYFDYIDYIMTNDMAVLVKLCDLGHNLSRKGKPHKKPKYRKAMSILNGYRRREISHAQG